MKSESVVTIPVLVRDPLKRHAFHSPELCEEIKRLVDVRGTELKRKRRIRLMRPPVRPFHSYSVSLIPAFQAPPATTDIPRAWALLKAPSVAEREFIEVECSEYPF